MGLFWEKNVELFQNSLPDKIQFSQKSSPIKREPQIPLQQELVQQNHMLRCCYYKAPRSGSQEVCTGREAAVSEKGTKIVEKGARGDRARTETPFNPIDGPIDGHRNFFRCASMDHRWPSMGFELSPSAWGQLWSIFGLNISNFNLLSFPFEPEQAFSSLKITYIGALSLNCLKKLKTLAKLQLFA